MTSATSEWRSLLRDLLARGEETEQASRGAEWRGRTSRELICYRTEWPMSNPVVRCPNRKLSVKFMAAEAAWVLSGSNRLDVLRRFAPSLAKLSDDGLFMSGAYGPPWVEQLSYVVGTLAADPASRQAVATLWRPRPGPWRDTPCTIGLQLIIRGGALQAVAYMRSSDAWMGVPYDVHTFSAMAAQVALLLRERLASTLPLGTLRLVAGSQHLYLLDSDAATRSVESSENLPELMPLDLDQFIDDADLIRHLRGVADGAAGGGWLVDEARFDVKEI